jgi:small subunit ribosomal protein S8
MQDPIADMLTRIRNGQSRGKSSIEMPYSKVKEAISKVLVDEGYLGGLHVSGAGAVKKLMLDLKYYEGIAVIDEIKRISRPGLRIYKSKENIPRIKGGLGVAIVSTCQGIMGGQRARALGIGGELLCTVA